VLSGVTNRSVILHTVRLFVTSRLRPADEILRHEKSLEIFRERRITFDEGLNIFKIHCGKIVILLRMSYLRHMNGFVSIVTVRLPTPKKREILIV
jgi:hypothetical protein